MKIKMFLLFIFSTFFYFLPLDAKNPKSCQESVNILHETLIKNNNSKQNVEFRLDLIQQELKGVFDYKKMIRMIYGHDWKKLDDLIPINFKKVPKYKKTGKAGIFAGSLELVKEGNLNIKQKNLFDEIYIKEK